MKLDYRKLSNHVEKNLSPVYVFSGEEEFLKEELLKELISRFNSGFNINVFYGGESSGEDIVSSALTLPFGSSRRLVIVKSAEQLTQKDRERIFCYLENPSSETLFVLEALVKSGSNSFFNKVSKIGVEIDFRAMYENEVLPWLMDRAKALGKRLPPRVAYGMKEHTGCGLRLLANELDKLILEVGDRREISIGDVEAITGESRVVSPFELVNAIGSQNRNLALKVLSSLLQRGKNSHEIIALLAWQFRRIWSAKVYTEKGMRSAEVAKLMKVPNFSARGLIKQAQKFSHNKLRNVFAQLLETDVKTKSGESPALALEVLVIRLCR